MRLATVRLESGTRAALVADGHLTLLPFSDVGDLLAADGDWRELSLGEGHEVIPEAGITLAPVIPHPEKIICVGLNYRGHAKETGNDLPEYPTFFTKYWRSLIGPTDDLILPANAELPDWEAELCVVVGRSLRHADVGEAHDAIAGYAVLNDVTMRDWQRRTRQWLQGKTFEATAPLGPHLVTLDELDDPDDLRLECEVDGVGTQDARTSDLVFSPAELLAYASQLITLVPGDLIATGTPGGVGAARRPPARLEPGQTLVTRLEGVGALSNVCVEDPRGRGQQS